MAKSTCSVPVCDEPVYGRGWCKAHYQRWLSKGDVGTTPIRKKQPGSLCSVPDCGRAHYAHYLCLPHYRRELAGNDLGGPDFIVHPLPREELGYFALHQRIRTARGLATAHLCRCGAQAAHWAYQHNDPDPLFDEESGMPYSSDVDGCYEPMCHSCHIRLDRSMHQTAGWHQ